MKIPVEKINIGVRQRIDLGDLTDLDSIADKDVGLICPIIVHRVGAGYELVDGMRRLTKVKQLGWKEVEVFEKDTLTVAQKELCEFFADVARKDRTWQEQCIATHKLFHILRFEKREEGQTWTVRSMEKFCGMSKTEVHYRLKVAEGLLVDPRDEELWGVEGISSAQKLLLSRANKATTAELERRRMLVSQANAMSQSGEPMEKVIVAAGSDLLEAIEPSAVQVTDTTAEGAAPASAAPIKVRIFGYNKNYDGQGKDFLLAISFNGDGHEARAAYTALADNGYIAMFGIGPSVDWQNSPLYWNRVTPSNSYLPFYDSVLVGAIASKSRRDTHYEKPMSNNFTSMDFSDGKELERLVVHALAQKCTEEGQTVLCLPGVNPAHLVEIDRVPVFYEPDPVIFAERVDQLKEEYMQKFSNVEFEMV
jgi:hypothetical protein